MNIRLMLPMGTHLRKCIVCGYPITAQSDELTDHETTCLNIPKQYLTATAGSVKMPYRPGDPTVDVEARIEVTTAKAYLIEPTMGSKKQTWLPKSQTVEMSDADENGNRVFTVTKWWHERAELEEDE